MKMREDKKRRLLCHLSYSAALFSNYCIPLHSTQDQAMGHAAHSSRWKASKDYGCAHQTQEVLQLLFV